MLSKKLPLFNDSIDVSHKRVIVRIDFNMPVEDGIITDDYRIIKTLPLLKQLHKNGARLLLLSHLTEKKIHRSFQPLLLELQRITGFTMEFASSLADARASKAPIVLLENLRMFSGEEKNDTAFAEDLASLGELYINEDFSQSHRPYASIVQVPKCIPSYIGPLFKEEVEKLETVLDPKQPFMLVLGGVKFNTKVGVLNHFMDRADKVFIGGALANTFLAAKGYSVGASSIERTALPHVRETFLHRSNLILPVDVRVQGNEVRDANAIRKHDIIYDIGPASIATLAHAVQDMKMILWNGPLGFLEKGYEKATIDFVDVLATADADSIIGGGDTMRIIRKRKLDNAFYHLSTGGGAMLSFLANGTLPGIDALLENKKPL
jgi:phosphoglycerate kinase